MGCHNIHPNDLLEVILFSIIIAFYSLFRSKKRRYLSLLFYSKYILKVSIAHLTTLIMTIAELLSIHFWSSHYSAKHYFRSLNSGFLHCSPYSPKSTIFFNLFPALCPIFFMFYIFQHLSKKKSRHKTAYMSSKCYWDWSKSTNYCKYDLQHQPIIGLGISDTSRYS